MAILKRHIPDGDQDYTAGNIVNINLPRENFWRRVFLYFLCDGTAHHQVATTPMSAVFQEIRVLVDNQVLKSYKGQELASINCLNYGGSLTTMSLDTFQLTTGDELAMCIDFGLAPTDYRHMVASAELSSFVLQIVWAPAARLDHDADGPVFDGDLHIHSDEVVADDIPVDKLGLIQEREISSPVLTGTANNENTIKLPLGNIYRRFILWGYHSDIWKLTAPSDFIDLFRVLHNGNVTLQTGYSDRFEAEDFFDYRRINTHREGETAATDYAYYERPLVIDFDKDVANLDEVIDTARSSSLEFWYREDGGGDATNDYLKCVTQEIIP